MGTAADRAFLRLKTSFPIHFKKTEHEKSSKGTGLDLSIGGLAFETAETLPAETVIRLEFRCGISLRRIHVSGRVVRQVIPKELSKSSKYLTAIQFKDLSEKDLDIITGYILKKTRSQGVRWAILGLGLVLFAVTVFRVLDAWLMAYYTSTPFGKEWLTGVWSSGNLLIYIVINFIFGLGLICACFETFFLRRWAVKILIVLSGAGVLSQFARIFFKFREANGDSFFHAMIGVESLILFVYLFFVFLLTGKDFNERLEAHWSFVSHREYDKNKTQKSA